MLTRILADSIDAWLALSRLVARARPYWLATPGDLLGRLVALACGVERESRRIAVDGLPDAVLLEDPRLARYLDNVPLRPTAQTLGRYVVARGPLSDAIVRHELVHVRQWATYGPLYLPLYGLASALAILAGRHRYHDNPFEMAARAAEPALPAGPGLAAPAVAAASAATVTAPPAAPAERTA